MQEVIEKILRDTGEFEEEDIKKSAEMFFLKKKE